MRNRRFHSTGKGSPPPYRQSKVMPQAVFGKIILAGGEAGKQKQITDMIESLPVKRGGHNPV